MKMDYKKIGQFIAALRRENKMTQEDLAKQFYVERATISKWERGENSISLEVLVKISEIFDVTINEVILGEKQADNNKKQINDVTVEIFNKNSKLRKKLFYCVFLILILVLSFFSYYFINNYNSIKVYIISGENDFFETFDGLLIV